MFSLVRVCVFFFSFRLCGSYKQFFLYEIVDAENERDQIVVSHKHLFFFAVVQFLVLFFIIVVYSFSI